MPTDVLITINEQRNRQFTDGTGRVIDPLMLTNDGDPTNDFDDLYSDVDGDGFVVPLDTLLIVNFLANSQQNTEGEGGSFVPLESGLDDSRWTLRSRDDAIGAPIRLSAAAGPLEAMQMENNPEQKQLIARRTAALNNLANAVDHLASTDDLADLADLALDVPL